jgi:hypothetical protein
VPIGFAELDNLAVVIGSGVGDIAAVPIVLEELDNVAGWSESGVVGAHMWVGGPEHWAACTFPFGPVLNPALNMAQGVVGAVAMAEAIVLHGQ